MIINSFNPTKNVVLKLLYREFKKLKKYEE